MSEKGDKRTSRRLRYRRLRQPRNERRGVSPVVATLILILIAVAAAAALYLWLVGWQGSVTGSISKPGVNQGSFTMGGSTSVYPFSSLGATWYEQNNTGVSISDTQGGTGAGMLAVCSGGISVGAASTPETASGLIGSDGCPASDASTITITTVAYDAVDVVVQGTNTHGLLSMNYDTLNVIYSQGSTVAPNIPVTATSTIDGVALSALQPNTAYSGGLPAQGTEFEWAWLPAAVQGAAFTGIGPAADSPEAATTVVSAAGAPCTGVGFTNNICAAGGPGTGSPCGFTVCMSGAATIAPVERSDASGTTQTFEAKLLGYTASNKIAGSFSALGYSGCGSNNVLSDCGITLPAAQQGNGNPGVLADVAASPNAIGYASDGLARTYTGVGTSGIIPFAGVGQVSAAGVPQSGSGFVQTSGGNVAYNGIVPSTGASGSIAGGITSSASINNYVGWRPFELVTLQAPTGVVASYISFLLEVGINTNLATATGEVSVYSI